MCGRAGGRRFGRVANLASQVLSPRVRTGCAAAMDSPLQTVAFSSMLDYHQGKNKRMSDRPTRRPTLSAEVAFRVREPNGRAGKGGRPAGHPSSSGSSEGRRGTGGRSSRTSGNSPAELRGRGARRPHRSALRVIVRIPELDGTSPDLLMRASGTAGAARTRDLPLGRAAGPSLLPPSLSCRER
jgi:hypothetical protein